MRFFQVEKANVYEDRATANKVVQIKIIEILFKKELCNLVYMRDITKMVEGAQSDSTTRESTEG